MFPVFSDTIRSFKLIIGFRVRFRPHSSDVGSGTVLTQSFPAPQWCQCGQASTNNGDCVFGEKPEERAGRDVLVHGPSAAKTLNLGHEGEIYMGYL